MGRPGQADEMPLQPQLVVEPFERWTLDFVGPFNLPSSKKAYILVATVYVTKWVEAIDFPRATEETANGKVESINKVLEVILTKIVSTHRQDWVAKLPKALWAYCINWPNTTTYSPYQLVFGKESIFPIEFEIKTIITSQEVGLDPTEAQMKRLQQLNELDDARLLSLQRTVIIQQQRVNLHGNLIKK
eukprot:PITA_21008